MIEKEAMWIRLNSRRQFAIKIYVGGVNAVSGEPAFETMATKLNRRKCKSDDGSLQDYVVTPQQLWIDGIASADGKVRQFVAVQSGQGFTVEAQVTGEEVTAGLQFEVTGRQRIWADSIYVEYPKEQKTPMIVDLEMPIREFHELLHEKFGLEADCYKLTVRGVKCRGRYLRDCGISRVS